MQRYLALYIVDTWYIVGVIIITDGPFFCVSELGPAFPLNSPISCLPFPVYSSHCPREALKNLP